MSYTTSSIFFKSYLRASNLFRRESFLRFSNLNPPLRLDTNSEISNGCLKFPRITELTASRDCNDRKITSRINISVNIPIHLQDSVDLINSPQLQDGIHLPVSNELTQTRTIIFMLIKAQKLSHTS